MEILLQNLTTETLRESEILLLAKKVCDYLSPHVSKYKSDLTLVFVSSQKMQDLNSTYRHKDYVTDVLSFEGEEESLGELVFCISKLKEQALDNQHRIESEFLYLLIHGILHLCGYDHEVDHKEADKMFKIQDKAFEDLNTQDTVLF